MEWIMQYALQVIIGILIITGLALTFFRKKPQSQKGAPNNVETEKDLTDNISQKVLLIIIATNEEGATSREIQSRLRENGFRVSLDDVMQILRDLQRPKLIKRFNTDRGIAYRA